MTEPRSAVEDRKLHCDHSEHCEWYRSTNSCTITHIKEKPGLLWNKKHINDQEHKTLKKKKQMEPQWNWKHGALLAQEKWLAIIQDRHITYHSPVSPTERLLHYKKKASSITVDKDHVKLKMQDFCSQNICRSQIEDKFVALQLTIFIIDQSWLLVIFLINQIIVWSIKLWKIYSFLKHKATSSNVSSKTQRYSVYYLKRQRKAELRSWYKGVLDIYA